MEQMKPVMKLACHILPIVPVVIATVVVLGCSSGPTAVKVPPIEPEAVTDAVISQYDKNGDGQLALEELADCPALLDAMKNNIDKDNDKRLSKEELTERFSMWVKGGVGASFLACRVTKGGRPVEGAHVRLIPESFFGDVIQPAEGTTDKRGSALLAMDSANLPADLQNLRAVQQGLYRVEITHPSVDIPAKFNTQTTLGVEVSFESGRNLVEFKL